MYTSQACEHDTFEGDNKIKVSSQTIGPVMISDT